jgi:hypothetical protein
MEQARQVEDQKRSAEERMHSQEYDAPPIDLPQAGGGVQAALVDLSLEYGGSPPLWRE